MDGWITIKLLVKVNILMVLDFLQTQFALKFTEIGSVFLIQSVFDLLSRVEKIKSEIKFSLTVIATKKVCNRKKCY